MITVGCSTYNGASRLAQLLASIALRTPSSPAWRLAIVDDGSPRSFETRAVVADWATKLPIRYVEHGVNRGISAGWNTAARAFDDAEIVVLVNDDVIVPSCPPYGWLAALVYPLTHGPETHRIGSTSANWHAFTDADVEQLLTGIDGDRAVVPRDPGTKEHKPERRSFEDHAPGRVMCPAGELFAFRRQTFDDVGGFDENMRSFFEESSFGTACAERGMISAILSWPQCWHRWSATFNANPELQAVSRMEASRARYRQRWGVPDSIALGKEFDYTHPKYMNPIAPVTVLHLKKDGSIGKVSI